MIEKSLTTEEVCRRYGMKTRKTLSDRVKKRAFPAPTGKIGRSKAWDVDVLDEFDERSKKESLENVDIATANVL